MHVVNDIQRVDIKPRQPVADQIKALDHLVIVKRAVANRRDHRANLIAGLLVAAAV